MSSVSTVTATPKAAVKAVEGEDTACTKVLKAYLAELAASWATSSQQHVMKSDLSRNECFYCKKTFGCRSALFNHLRSEKHFSLGVSAPNTFSRYAPSDLEKTKAKASMLGAMKLVSWLLSGYQNRPISQSNVYYDLMPSLLDYRLDTGEPLLTLVAARAVVAAATPGQEATRAFCLHLLRRAFAKPSQVLLEAAEQAWAMRDTRDTRDQWPNLTPLLSGTAAAETLKSPLSLAREARDAGVLELMLGVNEAVLGADDALEAARCRLREPCSICLEPRLLCAGAGGALATVSACGHTSCAASLAEWLATQVDDMQRSAEELSCASCLAHLTSADLAAFASRRVAERAQRLSLEKALVGMGDWVWCPQCSSGGFKEGSGLGGSCKSLTCVECGFSFCAECSTASAEHATPAGCWLPCAEAQQNAATASYVQQFTKACPKAEGGCGVATIRDGGCSHMTCRVCKFQWCWLCGGKYKGKYTMGDKCPCG